MSPPVVRAEGSIAGRTPGATNVFAQPLALWSAVLGLIVGTATLLAATTLSAAPGSGALAIGRIGMLFAAFLGPFLLALAPGTATIFSGVGFFLIAASAGLITAWWISRRVAATQPSLPMRS